MRWSRHRGISRLPNRRHLNHEFVKLENKLVYVIMSIKNLEHCGKLIHDCSQEGERRSDGRIPAHPNGIPVSENRWLLVYATRSFRGNDDDCSIIYQLRADQPDGKVISEGILGQATDDWQIEGLQPGVRYKKLNRQPTAFGVPKGALINGREAPHANVFAVLWIRVAREFNPTLNYVMGTDTALDPEMLRITQVVEWTQVRLNEAEDDIETIRPPEPLRQVGYESGPQFCDVEDALYVVSNMQQAIPYNKDCTEWVEMAGFSGNHSAALKHRFNSSRGCYEWTETGPFIMEDKGPFGGGHLVRCQDEWAFVRTYMTINGHVWSGRGLGWIRLEDPFAQPSDADSPPELFRPPEPATRAPATFYLCGDGVIRCFCGAGPSSPYGLERNPLFCWDIDPDDGFNASNRRVIFDTFEAGLPIRKFARPMLDMPKMLPCQGPTQYLVHRVIATAMFHEHTHTRPEFWIFPPLNRAEIDSFGIYYAKITYKETKPTPWSYPIADEKCPNG